MRIFARGWKLPARRAMRGVKPAASPEPGCWRIKTSVLTRRVQTLRFPLFFKIFAGAF
jgi:hypothetical protein